jgi:hypothetical protein
MLILCARRRNGSAVLFSEGKRNFCASQIQSVVFLESGEESLMFNPEKGACAMPSKTGIDTN